MAGCFCTGACHKTGYCPNASQSTPRRDFYVGERELVGAELWLERAIDRIKNKPQCLPCPYRQPAKRPLP